MTTTTNPVLAPRSVRDAQIATLRRHALARPAAIAVIATLIAWSIGQSSLARNLDGQIADMMMASIGDSGRAAVLLISVPTELAVAHDPLIDLVDMARDAGASAIGISRLPGRVSAETLGALAERDVLVGRPRSEDLKRPGAWPAVASEPAWALSDLLPAESGVHRRMPTRFRVASGRVDSFAHALARRAPGTPALDEDSFLVNFMLDGPLPSLTADQALAGSLIPELVRDRLVIIGPALARDAGGLATPVSGAMSAARFHGHAVDTLARQRPVRMPGDFARLAVLLLVAAASIWALKAFGARNHWYSLAVVAGLLVTAAASLAWLDWRLPITEVLALQFLLAALSNRDRTASDERDLRELIAESSHRLRRRVPTSSFLDSPEYWRQVVNLVNQTLELDRVLFLDRNPGEHRVTEIIAHGCSIEEIVEQRRDYDREPYRSAIAARGPLWMEDPYLTPTEDEAQYLVPLVHAGEVQGFWALSIDDDRHPDRQQFESAVQAFAEQIAELLHLRRQWQFDEELNAHVDEALVDRPGDSPLGALHRTIAAIERRLEIFEDVFASQQTATIVYDLFGQVVQTNTAMETLLDGIEFPTATSTALDLLMATTGQDQSYCQGLLRVVILQRRPLSLGIRLNESENAIGERECQLTIGPVAARPQDARDQNQEVRPFELAGLMIELQDVTRVHRMTALKEDLIERVGFRLRGDAEAIVLATSLLDDETLEDDIRAEVVETLVERTRSATEVMEEVRRYLAMSTSAQPDRCYPLDATTILRRVLEDAEEAILRKRLDVDLEQPSFPHLVIAEADAFTSLATALVSLLVEDAGEGTTLRIAIQEAEGRQLIQCFNEGFGIPDERFQHFLDNLDASAGPEYERLRDAAELLESWGGSFRAHSAIGSGFEFHLTLATAL